MEAAPDVLDVFRRGLRRELHQIVSEPALLFQQLHNRLQWDASPEVRGIGRRPNASAGADLVAAHGADGRWIVSGSDHGTARVWDLGTGRQLATDPVVDAVLAVAAHPRLPRFACGGSDGVLWVLDVVICSETTSSEPGL